MGEKKSKKKLALKKETLRRLNGPRLAGVRGGGTLQAPTDQTRLTQKQSGNCA